MHMDNNYTNIYYKKGKKGIKTELDLSQIETGKINGQEYIKY